MFIYKPRALQITATQATKQLMAGLTNTIIVTSNTDDVLDKLEPLKQWLTERVLSQLHITAQHPVEIIVLRNFQRVMIISPTRQTSQQILQTLQNGDPPFSLSYNHSMADTDDQSVDYLKVPKSEKMFLISPPTSPPPGFDYSRCEQPPPRAHTVDQQPHAEGSEFLTLLDSKIASIALQRCEDTAKPASTSYTPTQMPPRPFDEPADT